MNQMRRGRFRLYIYMYIYIYIYVCIYIESFFCLSVWCNVAILTKSLNKVIVQQVVLPFSLFFYYRDKGNVPLNLKITCCTRRERRTNLRDQLCYN